MPVLNTRPVVALLNNMQADPDLTRTALGRAAVLNALASVVGGLGAAVANLDEKIYPPLSPRRWTGTDRRWRAASAQLDSAARLAGCLDERLQAAAERCRRVITDYETVDYRGSLTQQHGTYRIDGPCICEDCDNRPLTLRLLPLRAGHELTCVNPHSVSPTAAPDHAAVRGVHRVERLLAGAVADLPPLLDATHAAHLTRSLTVVAGRTRTAAAPWSDLIADQLTTNRWMCTHGGGNPYPHIRYVHDTLNYLGPALTAVQTDLRKATRVLADIEAYPDPAGRQAA